MISKVEDMLGEGETIEGATGMVEDVDVVSAETMAKHSSQDSKMQPILEYVQEE